MLSPTYIMNTLNKGEETMEHMNLAIVNTREGIIQVIKESKLPAMVVRMILGELTSIVEKEADTAINKEYEEYKANLNNVEEVSSEKSEQ